MAWMLYAQKSCQQHTLSETLSEVTFAFLPTRDSCVLQVSKQNCYSAVINSNFKKHRHDRGGEQPVHEPPPASAMPNDHIAHYAPPTCASRRMVKTENGWQRAREEASMESVGVVGGGIRGSGSLGRAL